MVIDNQEETVKEKCLVKAQNVLLDKTVCRSAKVYRRVECILAGR